MQDDVRVLFVDDDAPLRTAFERTLKPHGLTIDLADGAKDALEKASDQQYAVIATDYRMPEMNGLEAIEALKSLQPDATFMLVSGECDLDLALDAVNQHAVSFVVPKPWDSHELLELVNRSITKYLSKREQREMVTENERMLEQKERLDEALAQSEEQFAELLLNALDLRDHETRAHCRRVCLYTATLGEKLQLNDAQIRDLRKGALLHDVGKIGIPDNILLKPGKLTDEEWRTMRTHTTMGGQLVKSIPGLAGAYDVVTQHHEKWDGSGYPNSLKGEEISLGARIFMVADTLDAILSDRPYRKGASIEVARAEIEKFSGTQFDPYVVSQFLEMDSQFWMDVRQEFPDEGESK